MIRGLRNPVGRPAFAPLLLAAAAMTPLGAAAGPGAPRAAVELPSARRVSMGGELGEALRRGVERLGRAPYTAAWLRADISFEVNRIFTNYSGDVSGRFLELASLTAPKGRRQPGVLDAVAAAVPALQRPDGHFGADVDLNQPLAKGGAAITLLWGNARLLVGLVTAARELNRPALLECARRLGDFYVHSAPQLCSPDRRADYRSSGTYGDSYTCCYFPAIEGLVMLYRATGERRYLAQAERMAAFFREFDALPVDHSHGNLCTWRGILDLYDVTRDRALLAGAEDKWRRAVRGGFVWPIGGVGEHWYVSFNGDEGCSESDWLRFNLELWRHTGRMQYLDMAERLLENQYIENQCATGGFGWRAFETDAAGPYATSGAVQEWNFCCSFHGPLGLHFLKSYLAVGSPGGIQINFPYSFAAPVRAGGAEWRVEVAGKPNWPAGICTAVVSVRPRSSRGERVAVRMRMPAWASEAMVETDAGRTVRPVREGGCLVLARGLTRAARFIVRFRAPLRVESRRFQPEACRPGRVTRFEDVAVLVGPRALYVLPAEGVGRPTIVATVDARGRIDLPRAAGGAWRSALVPAGVAGAPQVAAALRTARPVALSSGLGADLRRAAFAVNLLVVPAGSVPRDAWRRIAGYTPPAPSRGPVYGDLLERRPDAWQAPGGWKFGADGLCAEGGDIGLIAGRGYADYRFEFDMRIPPEGEGITGWVVRAQDGGNCVMFQLQTADSTYRAPEFKTKPNTLRPHVRRGGAWTIADPVPLPKTVRRGEWHHVAVECRGPSIAVFLDGERIHEQSDAGLHAGAVGFRAAGAGEAGEFRHISLRRLP